MTISEAECDSKRRILKTVFGFDSFRPGQGEAIDTLLARRNLLTVMPTGSGKSLCYQLPALVMGGLTIVVSPLLALMRDQVAALKLAGIAAEMINSAQDRAANVAAWRRVAAGETRLLYLSPERLMTELMLQALSQRDLKLIAIDEAHCISQWGPSFRPEYKALSRVRELFPNVPIAALTATADEITRADIAAQLFAGEVHTLVMGFDRPNIALNVDAKTNTRKQLLAFLARHKGESGIVYCLSRKRTEQFAETLASNGISALAYHAGMSREQREANQNRFMTEPALVIVATIAFGMGIDKSDVRFVFHADLPGSLEAYYQEIGRAGRDGQSAEAHMLYGYGDVRMRRTFIDGENSSPDRRRREHQRLDALIGYCQASTCRRQILLGWFGEQHAPCGNCDNCVRPVAASDATVAAQKVLSAIRRTGERYGAAYVIDILKGTASDRIVAAGHDKLPTFGVGADTRSSEWHAMVRQLVAGGFVSLDIAGYGGLSITEKGALLLQGRKSFLYRPLPQSRRREARNSTTAVSDVPDDLLQSLKQLRLKLARERNAPAFVIFSDRVLQEMAACRPQDLESFSRINGVGAAKLKEFGEVFLEVVRASCP